jgi:hypothetical protein
MGMRKVMGSSQRQLIMQILLECCFIVFLAALVSVVLNAFWLPTFNQMFGAVKVVADYFNDLTLVFVYCRCSIIDHIAGWLLSCVLYQPVQSNVNISGLGKIWRHKPVFKDHAGSSIVHCHHYRDRWIWFCAQFRVSKKL